MWRYLRIAAAVVFVTLALAFVALWVRSYWSHDEITGPVGNSELCLSSDRGALLLGVLPYDIGHGWELRHYPVDDIRKHSCALGFTVLYQGGWGPSGVLLSHWFLAASFLALAWLARNHTWSFTVRGLLITTTVIAAMLGLVVYAV